MVRCLVVGNAFGAGSRRACVVDSPLAYGLLRMFQAFDHDNPDVVEIFEDIRKANEWLGLAADTD
jgi:hypothetical protein